MQRQPAIRLARVSDIPVIAEIYAYHVLHGFASFEVEPPTATEMNRRYEAVRELGLPYLAAEIDGRVVGYAYANAYRTRPAYRYTVEDSVYVHPDSAGQRIGSALLPELIAGCERAGRRQMIAVIGDSENWPSIKLHEKFGFKHTGLLPATGYKFGRWVDSVLMQRELGPGSAQPPC